MFAISSSPALRKACPWAPLSFISILASRKQNLSVGLSGEHGLTELEETKVKIEWSDFHSQQKGKSTIYTSYNFNMSYILNQGPNPTTLPFYLCTGINVRMKGWMNKWMHGGVKIKSTFTASERAAFYCYTNLGRQKKAYLKMFIILSATLYRMGKWRGLKGVCWRQRERERAAQAQRHAVST